MNTIYHHIYHKLIQLAPDLLTLNAGDAIKSPGTVGLMDLNLDVLYQDKEYMIISLSHYYKHESGDMIPDPHMEIRISTTFKTAEALTFQDMYRYDEIDQNEQVSSSQLKNSLNSFLHFWLNNCLAQNHKLEHQ